MSQVGRIWLQVDPAQPACGASLVVRDDGSVSCWNETQKTRNQRDNMCLNDAVSTSGAK